MRRAQPFDGRDRSDSATSSVRLAVQPRGGTSKFEGVFEIPAIENAIGESRVKKVAGAGSVRYGNAVGRAVPEAMAIPGNGALFPDGSAYDARPIFHTDSGESE